MTAALGATFNDLIAAGLLGLGQPDSRGRYQACLTQTGQSRYAALLNGHTRLSRGCR